MQLLVPLSLLLGSVVALPPFHKEAFDYRTRSIDYKPWELAQFNLAPFNLTDMCIECEKKNFSSPLFDCSIKFNWDDPNAEQSCTCEDHWQWDGVTKSQGALNNYSTNYLICKDDRAELFQFKFVDFINLSNFSLSLTHMYKDTKNFPTPTIANMFAQPNITLELMNKSVTAMTYSSPSDRPIKANITGMTI
ncbi:hypothetical protein F5Y06DRAFT_300162 [Hypoxylon sp. FL0890]|nr:hypothetical protein F5Y06DRAFT_300162 [Hypoxylon sp. FL0890]